MFNLNKLATHIVYMEEASSDGAPAGGGALSIEERLGAALYPDKAAGQEDGDDASDDEVELLSDDDQPEPKPDGELNADDDEVSIASILGLEDDKLEYDKEGKVVFNAIIDGKVEKVSVADMVKSYQLQGHVNNKSMQLETDRKEFTTTRDKAYQELTVRLQGLGKLMEVAEKSLLEDYQSIDWNTLRMTEPGEWAALQQQFQQRLQKIQQVKELGGQEAARISEEQRQQQQEAYSARINGELQKMVLDNPTWADTATMTKEFGEIGAFLRDKYGFTDEEVAQNLDARLMRLIQDARQFHSGKTATEKKLNPNTPKFLKPSTTGDRPSLQKARAVKAAKDAIRKSGGSIDAVAAAIQDRM